MAGDNLPALADDLQAAIRFGLRLDEIGGGSPYKLCFAGKGKSGASFGFMQGDMAAGAAMAGYLQATSYFTENPGNWPHTQQSAAAGAARLAGE